MFRQRNEFTLDFSELHALQFKNTDPVTRQDLIDKIGERNNNEDDQDNDTRF
jgi:hypothetical protein